MSALAITSVQLPDKVQLRLAATRQLPRTICVELSRSALRMDVYVSSTDGKIIASSSAPLDCCLLQLRNHNVQQAALWMDITGDTYAGLNVLPGEAEAIAAQFEPHGLRVQR